MVDQQHQQTWTMLALMCGMVMNHTQPFWLTNNVGTSTCLRTTTKWQWNQKPTWVDVKIINGHQWNEPTSCESKRTK